MDRQRSSRFFGRRRFPRYDLRVFQQELYGLGAADPVDQCGDVVAEHLENALLRLPVLLGEMTDLGVNFGSRYLDVFGLGDRFDEQRGLDARLSLLANLVSNLILGLPAFLQVFVPRLARLADIRFAVLEQTLDLSVDHDRRQRELVRGDELLEQLG